MRLPEKHPSSAGFTLIEMALVLVIIGLIIGAVLKGQDLINSARATKMSSWIRSAETAQWAHLDRKGKFANASTLVSDMDTLKNATLNLGGNSFDLSFINNNQTIRVEPDRPDEANVETYFESFDTSIDDKADGTSGSVYCNASGTISEWNATGGCNLQYNFATTRKQ